MPHNIGECPYRERPSHQAILTRMDEKPKKPEKTEAEQISEFLRKLSEKYGTDFDAPVPPKLSDLIQKLNEPDPE